MIDWIVVSRVMRPILLVEPVTMLMGIEELGTRDIESSLKKSLDMMQIVEPESRKLVVVWLHIVTGRNTKRGAGRDPSFPRPQRC